MKALKWMCLAVLLLVAMQAPPARAESCARTYIQVRPEPGATGVSRNTRIWLDGEWNTELTLLDGQGAAVEFTLSLLTAEHGLLAPRFTVVTPRQPLTAGEVYRLLHGTNAFTQFTVADTVDTVAPPRPHVTRGTVVCPRKDDGKCGGGGTCLLALDFHKDAEFLLVDRDGESTFDPASLSGFVTAFTQDSEVSIGKGSCTSTWPEACPGDTVRLHSGALDTAGNFSGWSDADEFTLDDPQCGCTEASADGRALGAALVVLLPGLRRRRE